MQTKQTSATAIVPRVKSENPEIGALIIQKSQLEHKQSGFETALSFALAATAVAAVMVFIFDLGVRRYSKRIQVVQDEIIRGKDAETKLALGEKDIKIGNVETSLENARAESTRRQTELEVEQRKTAEAQRTAAIAQLELKQHVEQVATPRRIIMGDRNGDRETRQALFAEVKKYAGTLALIQPVPGDFEALTLARDIGTALSDSGWTVTFTDESQSKIPAAYIFPGVHLYTLEEFPFKQGSPPKFQIIPSASQNAALAVGRLLMLDLGPNAENPRLPGVWIQQEYKDESMHMLTLHGFVFPPEAVVILVGQKPTVPFSAPQPDTR